MTAAVEAYYTPSELAVLLKFTRQWVTERIRRGDFGTRVLCVNGDYRVPARDVNDFLDRYRTTLPDGNPSGIKARTVGELRRKSA